MFRKLVVIKKNYLKKCKFILSVNSGQTDPLITWEDIFLYLVPSWHKNGTQFNTLKWPYKQSFTKELKNLVPSKTKKVSSLDKKGAKLPDYNSADFLLVIKNEIRKVLSWNEKSTKLFQKKSWYLISIMTHTAEPLKIE